MIKNRYHLVVAVPLDFIKPDLYVVKTLLVGNVINNNDSVSTSIKCRSYSSKPFLSSSIPQLQLDYFPIELYSVDFEIDPNSCIIAFMVCIVDKS